MEPLVYINGQFYPKSEAKISVFDRGFLYGDGVFETLRAYQGKIFKIEDHIHRLFASAEAIKLNILETHTEIKELLNQALTKNNLKDAYVRISVSRGVGAIGLDPAGCSEPTLVIIVKEFKGYPQQMYEEGIKISIVSTMRNLKEALPPAIKSANFLNNILAKMEAKEKGVDEGIMLNKDGFLCEGTVSNLFFVKEGKLKTPSAEVGLLDGITRRVVIDLAIKNNIEVEEGFYHKDELFLAEECFLTNTTYEIMPVTKIDNHQVGDGQPGEMTKVLHREYKELLNPKLV